MFRGKGIFYFANILIDFLMIISINSAIREDNLLGALFLFGVSYLGAFIGKKNCGKCGITHNSNQIATEDLNNAGLALSMLMLTCCMVVALGVVELHIVSIGNFFPIGSEILLQSADRTYLPFGAVNVTWIIMVYMAYPLIIHLLMWEIEYIDQNHTEFSQLTAFWVKKWSIALLCLVISVLSGLLFCACKYWLKAEKFAETAKDMAGKPQYLKYMLCFGIIGLGLFLYISQRKYIKKSENA